MLGSSEKDYPHEIIAGLIGEDSSIKAYRSQFNESTIGVVEKMVAANSRAMVM